MSRTSLALALAAFCAGAFAAQQPFATLGHIDGTVMVNQGERYVTATEGMALSPGDRVMVMAASKADVVFSGDHCSLPLGANVVTSIPAQSTCAGGVADVRKYGPSYAQALGDTPPPPPPEKSDDDDNHKMAFILAGVAAGVVIACEGDHRHHCHHDHHHASE